MNVFVQLRNNGNELKRLLHLTPFARSEFEMAYEYTENPLERARHTIIKSFMGFGSDSIRHKSGFRANSNRSGTTPAHDWRNYAEFLDILINRLRGVIIESRDYAQVIAAHDSINTLFYIDPPYVHSARESSKRYTHEMSDEDHKRLSAILRSVKGKVVLSGYDCELYQDLYRGWTCYRKSAYADGARPRIEVLWTNFEDNRLL